MMVVSVGGLLLPNPPASFGPFTVDHSGLAQRDRALPLLSKPRYIVDSLPQQSHPGVLYANEPRSLLP